MSRLAVVLLLTLAAVGCTRRQADFAWFAVAVAAEVASQTNTATEGDGTGVATPDPDQFRGPSRADLQRAHDVAWELTRIAAHDARTDNCEAVVRTGNHVRVIDPAVFANLFLRDREIQRCLAFAPERSVTSGVTVIQ
jgi:pyruvate/2-oxoglutarate dehydrogenase complex dihydrolipoamide acyltransferase (E2) component